MSDLTTLQQTILADIAAASDEAAIEAVRVGTRLAFRAARWSQWSATAGCR